jgi:hypothetical protein
MLVISFYIKNSTCKKSPKAKISMIFENQLTMIFTPFDAQLNFLQQLRLTFVFIFTFLSFESWMKVGEKKILAQNECSA